MSDINLPTLLLAALPGLALLVFVHKKWQARTRVLERDLQEYADVMSRMAEVQSRVFERLSGKVRELEERLHELSVPSGDPELPLEKRHRVLSLARKGASSKEIARKLNVPRGEAELILGLKTYATAGPPQITRSNGDSRSHVKA
jgi:hypothetical protein